MKILSNLLSSVNIPKVVNAFKKSDNKNKISEISKIGGGGLLILEGINLIVTGSTDKNVYVIVAGALMLVAGIYIAERLGNQIANIDKEKTDDK